ncbi:MAG TPA: flagellar biosynthetic protein FliO [Steroidobacteraceae bacterium]|nr:flagellar biosynthetic protein FliO [Steroidobacteraceae bacterium]
MTPSEPQFIAQLLSSTLLVAALIVLLAWVAKRLRWRPRPGDGRLEVLAEFAVGGRERILLLRVGDRQALVGVGTGTLTSLQLLESPVDLGPGPAAIAPAPFERVLRAWIGAPRT